MNKMINIPITLLFYFLVIFSMKISLTAAEGCNKIESREIIDTWILDGEAKISIVSEYEIKFSTSRASQMTIWSPRVYEGPAEIEFDCLVPATNTKLLLLAYGHGIDGTPIWEWERDASYDNYNVGAMEVYSIGFNRGSHTYKKYGDELANVRRIGGLQFKDYTMANFKKHRNKSITEGKSFWRNWNTLSLLGGVREPVSGIGKYLHYRIKLDPPHIHLEVDGIPYGEIVDHRPNPLQKGSIAFRCMSKGKTFYIKNLVIKGLVVETKNR